MAVSFVFIGLIVVILASYLSGPAPGSLEQSAAASSEAPQTGIAAPPQDDDAAASPAQSPEATRAQPSEQARTEVPEAARPRTSSAPGRTEAPARQSMAPDAGAQPDEEEVRDLPTILSAADADRYRRIFALQKRRKLTAAKKIIAQLDNKLLMGHVLAQRLQRLSLPRYKDLRSWLGRYADHPEYGRIKRLAQARRRGRSRSTRPPIIRRGSLIAAPPSHPPYATKKNLTRKQRRRVSRIKRTARIWLRRGQITRTERLLRRRYVVKLLDRYEMDEARGMIAAAWFYHGKDSKAYKLANKVIARSGKALPMTHWIAGLAAWRMDKTKLALAHFEKLAVIPDMSGWVGAGAALWAARAYGKLGNKEKAQYWLEQAALHPYTLYGVMALTELNRDLPFEPRHHPLTPAKLKLLSSTKGGRRALALSQVGEMLRAEQELLNLREWRRPGMREALRAVADRLQLPSIAIRLTRHQVANDDDGRAGEPLDPALYPIPPWKPSRKSGIDRALLYAIMRQESDFNAYAHSPVGALGLMQIMPATARMLNHGRRPFSRSHRLDKFDPDTIVKFGLRYLTHLRTHKRVQDDLIRIIAAYNSGPGNIGYWARKRIKHDEDPLLFIEAIPNLETRLFVRRVLANLWIYRSRLGQRAPSLAAIMAGRFPHYKPIDGKHDRRTAAETSHEWDG